MRLRMRIQKGEEQIKKKLKNQNQKKEEEETEEEVEEEIKSFAPYFSNLLHHHHHPSINAIHNQIEFVTETSSQLQFIRYPKDVCKSWQNRTH